MDEKWATAKWANSGEIVRWLCDLIPGGAEAITNYANKHDRWGRRWSSWRRDPNTRVKVVTTLDEFLTHMGIPLSSAPDYVFVDTKRTTSKRGKKNLTAPQLKAMIKLARSEGTKAAAEKYNLTPGAVRYHVRRAKKEDGIESTARTSKQVDAAVEAWLKKKGTASCNQIARDYGVSPSSIRRRLRKMDVAC